MEAVVNDSAADGAAWQAAWRHAVGGLNQQRNPLRRKFSVPLILVGAHWLVPVMRETAPDLWSVRSVVVRIEPGELSDHAITEDIGRKGVIEQPMRATGAASGCRAAAGRNGVRSLLSGKAPIGRHCEPLHP